MEGINYNLVKLIKNGTEEFPRGTTFDIVKFPQPKYPLWGEQFADTGSIDFDTELEALEAEAEILNASRKSLSSPKDSPQLTPHTTGGPASSSPTVRQKSTVTPAPSSRGKIAKATEPSYGISAADIVKIKLLQARFMKELQRIISQRTLERNTFDYKELAKMNSDRMAYKTVGLEQLVGFAARMNLHPELAPTLLRRDGQTGEIFALCPFCKFAPRFLSFASKNNKSYSHHLTEFHSIVQYGPDKAFVDASQKMRAPQITCSLDARSKTLRWYMSCLDEGCSERVESLQLSYCGDVYKVPINGDEIMVGYFKHQLKTHLTLLRRR